MTPLPLQRQLVRRKINSIRTMLDALAQELDADQHDAAADSMVTILVLVEQLCVDVVRLALTAGSEFIREKMI